MSSNPYNFRSYLKTLYQYTHKQLPLAFGLLLATGLTESIGLVMLVPMLTIIGIGQDSISSNPVAEGISKLFTNLGIPFGLSSVLIIFFLLIATRAALMFWRDNYLQKVQLEFIDTFRFHFHKVFGQARWSFLMKQRSSDFLHILGNDVSRIGHGTRLLLQSIVSLSLLFVYLLTSLYISPYLTLLVVIAGGLLLWVLRRFQQQALQLGSAQTKTGKAVMASINEFLGGIKLVKSYGAEKHYLNYFKQTIDEQRGKQLAFQRNTSLAQQIFNLGSALLLCLFFYVAIEVLQTAIGSLLVLSLIFVRMMPLLSGLQRNYEQIMHMLPAYSAAMELKQACLDEAEVTSSSSSATPLLLNQAITLQNVTFAYHSETPILQQATINIPASQTTALMGESGAGKSTLADLLAGLMLPNQGTIYVDGNALTEQNLPIWRSQVAYVPQDVFLFHDSVKANMLWVAPTASDEELWAALDLAAAKPFVTKLPQGLDTVIGERGIRLSGGERQRIALARALLRKPSLLILDEATSALDHQNEQRIRDAIQRLHGSMTILLIAHRQTTVDAADQVFIIKDKSVIDSAMLE
jgi:ATP-binding cassette subfamily C protein